MTEYGRIHTDGSRSGGQPTQGYGVATAANYTSPIGGAGVVTHGVIGVAAQSDALQAENEQLRHDIERQMTIANEHVNEVERLREHLISALDTLKDAEVCDDNCGPCNEARAALEQSK